MADLPIKPIETPLPPKELPRVGASPAAEMMPDAFEAPRESAPAMDVARPEPTRPRTEPVPAPAPVVPRQTVPAKDPMTARIEDVLADDLTDVFLKMSPEKQAEFKQKGEETASAIRQMIEGAKVNARKVFDLIRDWLKLIPGVNKFFLEQEAKIKTDKILNLKP